MAGFTTERTDMNPIPAAAFCLLIAGCGELPPSVPPQGRAAEPAAEPAPMPVAGGSDSATAPMPGQGTVTKTLGGAAVEPQHRGREASAGDQDITTAIRKAIRDDGTLSARATEVSVSTINGKVTPRGTMASPAERSRIEEMARDARGIDATIIDLLDAGPQR